MNALTDYVKRISSELVLFDWAFYVRSLFLKHHIFYFVYVVFCCFGVVAVNVCLL